MEGLEDAGAFGGEDFGGGAQRCDASGCEADDFGVEQEGLFDVVGDGEDGNTEMRCVLAECGDEAVAGGAVDAGEGFVEEEEAGVGNGEGTGEVDALTLAAGEIAGEAVGEWGEVEEGQRCGGEIG
jgi:hypothetical protein